MNAATAEVAFDAPLISTRTVKTQLLIRDGHTAVLGRLTDQQRDVSRGGVPILSSIPILGGLFGRQVTRTSETELFIFIKPQVIRDDGAMQEGFRSPRIPNPERNGLRKKLFDRDAIPAH